MTITSLPDQKLLKEVTRRIVDSVKPRRVLLFGSAVKGKMNNDSDLDMLVVMRDPAHRRRTAQKIYRHLRGAGIAVDIVVATEKDLKEYGKRSGTILKTAISHGRVLYEA